MNWKVTAVFLAALLMLGGFVALDLLVLDPGGRGFAGEANDACKSHGGVKEMDALQGYIICWDGTAAR